VRAVKRGDEIVTAGGLVGEVIHVRESVAAEGASQSPLEDRITIKSGESRVIIERGKIARVISQSTPAAKTEG
jgi:preprotein translocase subunit YajC